MDSKLIREAIDKAWDYIKAKGKPPFPVDIEAPLKMFFSLGFSQGIKFACDPDTKTPLR